MNTAIMSWPFRKWTLVIVGALSITLFCYAAFNEIQKKFVDKVAVCPEVPEAEADCVRFLVTLRSKIISQGHSCQVIRQVILKPSAKTPTNAFDVTCIGADNKTLYRYEVEDRIAFPTVRMIQ